MAFNVEEKLVVAIASSALFDLSVSDEVFRVQGEERYREYQLDNIDELLLPGVAFPFIQRLLELNKRFPEERPVEVVLLSRNSSDTGRRVFRSAEQHGLEIIRGAFLSGKSPYDFIPSFNASLFLSANESDVIAAIAKGHPAGMVMPGNSDLYANDNELRVAFDFDGVIADDESEKVFHHSKSVESFQAHELSQRAVPHKPGPLMGLLKRLSNIQELEKARHSLDSSYQPFIKISVVTARSAPSNERFVTTLNSWGLSVDEAFFLGGMEKKRVLEILKPHIFFDDQLSHLQGTAGIIPSVHIPFGVKNLVSSV